MGGVTSRRPAALPRRAPAAELAVLGVTVALVACGGSAPATRETTTSAAAPGRSPSRPGSAPAAGSAPVQVFDTSTIPASELATAWGPAARAYTTADQPAPPVTGPRRFVHRAVEQAAEDASLRPDGRLDRLAEAVGRWVVRQDRTPPHGLVEALSRRLGLVEPAPHLLVVGGPAGSEALAEQVRAGLDDLLPRQPYNRMGMAVVVDGPGHAVVVVCLSSRWVELAGRIPRRLGDGETVTIDARLTGAFRRPLLVVQSPNGEVDRFPGRGGRQLVRALRLDGRGIHRIELLGVGPRGDTVIANFPVAVDTDPDDLLRVALGPAANSEVSTSAEMVARRLRGLVAEARAQAGVAALDVDEDLAAVARRHGEDMVAHRFVGHTSPSTGTAADRVRAAGIRADLVLENIGRGYGAQEIHQGLLDSPGHRANLLDPEVTHLGIGVVRELEGSRYAFVATQLFVRRPEPVDLDAARADLGARIARLRDAEAVSPLRRDAALDRAAARAATQYFDEPGRAEPWILDRAARRVEGRYRRVAGVLSLVRRVDDATDVEVLLDRRADAVGIGVAQGERPGVEPGVVAVVFLVAWDE